MAWLLSAFLSYSLLVNLAASNRAEISLNGDRWQVKDSLGKLNQSVLARVPGQVHLDLMRAGIIADPYENWNDWLYQWIGYSNWTYSTTFSLNSEDLATSIWLKCDGLDTIATISVNDAVIGHANNYHRRFVFEMTNVVKAGENLIRIDFESGANYSYKLASAYPLDLYTDIQGVFFNYSQRGFIRKTQSDFGWDWGIGLVPCGIWGDISVIFVDVVRVSDVVPKTFYDEDKKSYFISVTACVQVLSVPTAELTVTIDAISIALESHVVGSFDISVITRDVTCVTAFSDSMSPSVIESQYLWWPLGSRWGTTKESSILTEVISTVVVYMGTGNVVAKSSVTKNVGFRRIDLIQEPVQVAPSKTEGLSFYFQMTTADKVYPIYAKGSNFIPMDALVNRANKDSTRMLLNSFVEGNQNMLRVWGGGLYQPDWFYDLCDEMGIMVWQEFMFADALYPRDKDFLENVAAEIRDVVRRLGHHPSIVLWSGNNENQGILGNDTVRIVDYSALYDGVVRTALWEEDTTRLYWPSSPSNGVLYDDKDRRLFIQRWGDVSDPTYGDLHRYDYSDFCLNVTKFPTPRFVSEFGFQSYPSFASIKDISMPDDWSNDSPFMNHRNHHPHGNKQMEALIASNFNLPNNDLDMYKFMDFVYLSQVMQGLCMRAQVEHYRRFISKEGVLTRGTLYWQLNDVWQAQTWSSVDWSGRWKILHYYMRRAYAPILVSPYQMNDSIIVYVVLDVIDHEIEYTLEIKVISWETDETINSISQPGLSSKGFTGTEVFSETMDVIFKGTSPKESFLLLRLMNGKAGGILASNWHFPVNFTEVVLPEAVISATDFRMTTVEGRPFAITFELTASKTAPFVYLESRKYVGTFSDNGFLLRQKISTVVTFTAEKIIDPKDFQAALAIRSIRDTYSNTPYQVKVGRKT